MICRFLRFKGWYGKDWVGDAGLAELLARNETQYSCLRTCQTWGPDDAIAAPEQCASGRPCFSERSGDLRRQA